MEWAQLLEVSEEHFEGGKQPSHFAIIGKPNGEEGWDIVDHAVLVQVRVRTNALHSLFNTACIAFGPNPTVRVTTPTCGGKKKKKKTLRIK